MEADDAREEVGVAGVGHHAAAGEHVGPAGRGVGHDEVGEEGEEPPGPRHGAVHGAHDRLLDLPQRLERPPVVLGGVAVVERAQLGRVGHGAGGRQVGAGAEVTARASDDDGAHRPVAGRRGQEAGQPRRGGDVDAVAGVGPGQPQHGDGPLNRDLEAFGAHAAPPANDVDRRMNLTLWSSSWLTACVKDEWRS